MSSLLIVISGSLLRGDKWQMQLLTDTQVGNAMPVAKHKIKCTVQLLRLNSSADAFLLCILSHPAYLLKILIILKYCKKIPTMTKHAKPVDLVV